MSISYAVFCLKKKKTHQLNARYKILVRPSAMTRLTHPPAIHHSVFDITSTRSTFLVFFFFNDTATTETYTLSLHDALPICASSARQDVVCKCTNGKTSDANEKSLIGCRLVLSCAHRSEEHTSELQSHVNLVCRLLLEKKKNTPTQREIQDTSETVCNDTPHTPTRNPSFCI